jgi:aspartate dehydrogenase
VGGTAVSDTQVHSVGLLGYGAIGSEVAEAIDRGVAGRTVLRSILCRDLDKHAADVKHHSGVIFTNDPQKFFDSPAQIYIEAAGQDVLREYGPRILEFGCDLIITSIGAFTNDAFFNQMVDTADKYDSRMLLASGALPAVDWMSAAAPSGVESISITQIKPVKSWIHTPASELVNLHTLAESTCFFEGTAREAARMFPKSSNITAMLALATIGLDHTRVKLFADPINPQMKTIVEFKSKVGHLTVECQGIPTQKNPSTGANVPLSVIKALRNMTSTVFYGI